MPDEKHTDLRNRSAAVEMSPEEFRALGHQLVERIADYLATVRQRPVTPNDPPAVLRKLAGDGPLPEQGAPAEQILNEAAELVINHSLYNGHPRFWGYINPSSAPIGALGDLLAAAINPNAGAWILSPAASAVESQTVRWIAQMLGYPTDCGGLLVSGGNMANFVGFAAARRARAGWDVRAQGFMGPGARRLRAYVSSETHTWIHKATDLFGLGTDAIRWIPVDNSLRMDTAALRKQILADLDAGDQPFLVAGTAGTVSTGAVDPLVEIAAIAREHKLWFHVDGAYGGFAAILPDAPSDFAGIALADSVAVDPHKWLYAPLEAGCALVRDRQAMLDAFSYRPPYYHFDESAEELVNYFEYGLQNSRGFRALKVWLVLRQSGLAGYRRMLADDCRLSRELYRLIGEHPELEAVTQGLSITTFRYVPRDLKARAGEAQEFLNKLNTELLTRLQAGGEAFVSNAVVRGAFVLRACIVNFRTTLEDVEALPGIVARLGRQVDRELRPEVQTTSAERRHS
ncbi:MAG TPA: aspartate aminotransferase family protein [Terriglobia bacterium]|nr:aspartate aminotransferase family protein [Terriglobia bacterium]